MYEIVLSKSIDAELIERLIEMDHAAFPQEDWIAQDEAEVIYTAGQDCLVLLYQGEVLIGFVTALLLSENLMREAAEKDTPVYKLLDPASLSDGCNDAVYLHCFLLLPQHRKRDLVYALYKGLRAWLNQRVSGDIPIYAEAVSQGGINCLGRVLFRTVHTYKDISLLQKTTRPELLDRLAFLSEGKSWLNDVHIRILR